MESLELLFRVIVTGNTLVGLILVLGLVILAVVGGQLAVAQTRRYRVIETNSLNQVKTRLRQMRLNAGSAEEEAEKPLCGIVSAEELAQGVPPESIIGDRLRIIAQLRKSQTKVNLAALQQITRAHEAARIALRFPAMAVNLLMLIGLLGTFIGIAIVIQQIGLNIDLGDGSLQSFGKAFGGMYTKFSTTLTGLAGAIAVAVLNFRLAHAQERYFEDLDRFTVAELLPATIPVFEDETLLERVSRQLEQSFSLMQEIATKNAKTVEEVAAIQTGFADIVGNIRQQTRADAPDRLHNLLGQVAALVDQVGRVSEALQTLAGSLPAAVSESNRRLEHALNSRPPEQLSPAPSAPHKLPYAAAFLALGAAVVLLFITIVVRG